MHVLVWVSVRACVHWWGGDVIVVVASPLSSPPSCPHTHAQHHLQVLNGFYSSEHISPTLAAEVGERPREKSDDFQEEVILRGGGGIGNQSSLIDLNILRHFPSDCSL